MSSYAWPIDLGSLMLMPSEFLPGARVNGRAHIPTSDLVLQRSPNSGAQCSPGLSERLLVLGLPLGEAGQNRGEARRSLKARGTLAHTLEIQHTRLDDDTSTSLLWSETRQVQFS